MPSLNGDIVLEHLHRYAFAADLVAGKDVLDIACGEGYGSNLLAARARSVTGVDISEETIGYAQSKYVRDNLAFLPGSCLAIPAPDQSADVVVSFETLEHFVEHEQFLAEVRRVLRPGGVFIVSTPDKTIYTGKLGNRNQFHPRELEKAEFEEFLRGGFSCVQLLSQRVSLGSFLAPTSNGHLIEVGTHRGNFEKVGFVPGAAEGVYLIGVGSDSPLPPIRAGLFEFGQEDSNVFLTPLLKERASADAARREGENLTRLRAELGRAIVERDNRIAALEQASADAAKREREVHARLRAESERSIVERDSQIASLDRALSSQRQTIECLNQAVESAMSWQKRSWFKRAFQRWRPPTANRERVGFLRRLERSIRKRRKRFLSLILRRQSQVQNPQPNDSLSNPRASWDRHTQHVSAPTNIAPAPAVARRRVVVVSGEADTPGHAYRVVMVAESLVTLGYEVEILRPEQLSAQLERIAEASVLVIWRAAWSRTIAEAVAAARGAGAKVVFDVDDLMIDPGIARIEVIDGIRSQDLLQSDVAELYGRMQKTMLESDFCTCTSQPLATAMRRFQKATFVLPNGFDERRYRASREAVAEKRCQSSDGFIRIGYAGGSRTHQKDFGCAAAAVANILRQFPHCRLVLFRMETDSERLSCLDVHEFPELAGLEAQIEWRRMVPVQELPFELVRFDINLAPLETDNVFCEAKSPLKYFEAALVDVPTVASPTRPYAEAMQHGQTGFLAGNTGEWYDALKRLVQDPELRQRIGKAAALDVLWRFGPERRLEIVRTIFEQVLDSESVAAAGGFELELRRAAARRRCVPDCANYDLVFETSNASSNEVVVVVPLHNYARHVVEALESVKAQTLAARALVVVDDCSTDDSLRVAEEWLRRNAASFGHAALLANRQNSGLARTRNAGFAFADAPFILPLDADNTIEPHCLERCLKTIRLSGAAVAFATVQEFGDGNDTRSADHWKPARFIGGNYIDAMAMIRRAAWAAVGGYQHMTIMGWEDYDLWCRFVEEGFRGVWVPETLARYRVHRQSMLQTHTDINLNRRRLSEEMRRLHPWVDAL